MIYSRSPEQYDPTPFLDEEGKRYDETTAPANSSWLPRLYLVKSDDIQPVLDENHKRLTLEEVEEILLQKPQLIRGMLWLPRSGERHRHNSILSSIRKTSGGNLTRDICKGWLTTLEDFSSTTLIALSPGLDDRKIREAKIVLERLIRINEEVK